MRAAALIVLAWNQWPLTRRCLDSLFATDLDDCEVIVVDNGSSDDTPVAIAAYASRVRYLRLPENLGFVRGMKLVDCHADPAICYIAVVQLLRTGQLPGRLLKHHLDQRAGLENRVRF